MSGLLSPLRRFYHYKPFSAADMLALYNTGIKALELAVETLCDPVKEAYIDSLARAVTPHATHEIMSFRGKLFKIQS